MNRAALHEGLRGMRFETILDRKKGGEITLLEAAEMLGINERTFRRDRVPKGLRLAGITTVEAANAGLSQTYIADYNTSFAIEPLEEGTRLTLREQRKADTNNGRLIAIRTTTSHGQGDRARRSALFPSGGS